MLDNTVQGWGFEAVEQQSKGRENTARIQEYEEEYQESGYKGAVKYGSVKRESLQMYETWESGA